MSTNCFSKNRQFNLENPKDLAFIQQYMYASEDEFSDCSSIASEEEFSGEDVADGSDESEDEIHFHCDSVINGDKQEEAVTASEFSEPGEDTHTGKATNLGDVADSTDKSNVFLKIKKFSGVDDIESSPVDLSTNFSWDKQVSEKTSHFTALTPVSATGIDELSICSGTHSILETPKKSLNVPAGLTVLDVEEVICNMSSKRKKTTANDIIEYYHMQFSDKENKTKAQIALSKVLSKLKDQGKKKNCSEKLYDDFLFLFSDFGIMNSKEILQIMKCQSQHDTMITPQKSGPTSCSTPCTPSQSSVKLQGRKKMSWSSIKKNTVTKRVNDYARKVTSELSEFVDSSEGKVTKDYLLQRIVKNLLGDSFELREIPKPVKASKDLGLQICNRMSRRKMDRLRMHMKKNYSVSMTSRKRLQEEKKSRCTEVHDIRKVTNIKSIGVYSKFKDSMEQLVKQFDEQGIIPSSTGEDHTRLKIFIKDGFDGAGNQLKIKGCPTATMELMGYVALRIDDISEPGCAKTLWVNDCPNSHFCLRPLALILEKESADLIREMYKLYPESYEPFVVNIGKRPILVDVDIKRSMMDGKVQNIVSGRTGSYCHYCKFTAKTYYSKIINKNSEDPLSANLEFATYEQLIKAWDKIKHDMDAKSSERLGFVHEPISKQEYMSVLHMIINCCRTMLKNMAIAVSDLNKNKIDPTKKKTATFNAKWKQSKVEICAVLLEKMKIRTMEIGRGNTGSGLTGGEARKFFEKSDEVCDVVFPEGNVWKDKFKRVLRKLRVLLFLLMSNEPIVVPAYRAISRVTLDIIVREIPWMRIIPSLHKVLCHAWQFIERNDSRGLNVLSEEALEAKHAPARRIRMFNCFQGDTEINITQCHCHLQLESDPELVGEAMGKTVKTASKRKFDPTDRNFVALIDSKRKKYSET